MARKQEDVKRGIQYEKRQAKRHRGRHLGGPGRPDYVRGDVKAEVKNWKRPVHSGEIRKAYKKGIKEIVSKSGFTKPAIEEAKRLGIKLIPSPKEK